MGQLIGILIALAVGILIGRDAKTRGMSPWGWGIFVFLILIIGLPAYFIARKPKLENQSPEQAPEQISEQPQEQTPEETSEEKPEQTT